MEIHLGKYKEICRKEKAQINNIFTFKEKEENKRKTLGKRKNVAPFNRKRIVSFKPHLSQTNITYLISGNE